MFSPATHPALRGEQAEVARKATSSKIQTVGRKLRVLFLCTANSCRSQMAEGWARALASDVFEPCSAGVEARGLDPRAVTAMEENGVDISGHRSKSMDELRGEVFDLVVTVCDSAAESCPVFPGRSERIHRSFDDPPRLARDAVTEQEAMVHYRRIRDQMREFVAELSSRIRMRV